MAKRSSLIPQRLRPHEAKPEPKPAPTVKKTYKLPDYLSRALRLRAASEGVTERHIIMTALKAHGFEVHDIDNPADGRPLAAQKRADENRAKSERPETSD